MKTHSNMVSFFIIVTIFITISSCTPANNKLPAVEKQSPKTGDAVSPAPLQATSVSKPPPAVQPSTRKTPSPPPPRKTPKAPASLPAELPEIQQHLEDSDSSHYANEKCVLSGDNFLDNLYERPFTSQEMIYQPDLDITKVEFTSDEEYFFFVLHLKKPNPKTKEINGIYGIEFDLDVDGRGDLITLVDEFLSNWTNKGIAIYTDKDGDIGGPQPMVADESYRGNGYDTRIEPKGMNSAYARILVGDHPILQFAISRSMLNEPQIFLWNAWADNGLKNVTVFDYNDSMGPSEAGSPMKDSKDYPLKALYNLDNTCRIPFGFEYGQAVYPGMCIVLPEQKATPICYCTDECLSGCCGEWVCE